MVVQNGKTKHIGLLLNFFNVLLTGIDKDQVVTLVTLAEDTLRKKADDGDAPATDEGVDSLVTKVFDRSALILTLLHAVNSVLPDLVEGMSDMPRAEFLELDIDESGLIAYTIFAVNYDFFSRNLPHVLRLSLGRSVQSVARK